MEHADLFGDAVPGADEVEDPGVKVFNQNSLSTPTLLFHAEVFLILCRLL